MTYYVNINRNTIASNAKHGTNKPAVRIQKGRYGKPTYAHRVRFKDGEVIYSPHKPILPCGARLIIQTEHEPEVIE